jgi:hypothetical protein
MGFYTERDAFVKEPLFIPHPENFCFITMTGTCFHPANINRYLKGNLYPYHNIRTNRKGFP